ncbi:MAG: hypothetical protein RBJ76_14240 [Stenomitos frigidus ULC029]
MEQLINLSEAVIAALFVRLCAFLLASATRIAFPDGAYMPVVWRLLLDTR